MTKSYLNMERHAYATGDSVSLIKLHKFSLYVYDSENPAISLVANQGIFSFSTNSPTNLKIATKFSLRSIHWYITGLISTISMFSIIIVTEIPHSIISYKNSSTFPISSKLGFFSNSISFRYTMLRSIRPHFCELEIILGLTTDSSVMNAVRAAFRTMISR